QSDDLGFGQTGVILAELMGLPHATLIMHIESEGAGIRVKRELEDGWFQHVDMPLPALLTIQSGATKLRYATLMGIKTAKSNALKAYKIDTIHTVTHDLLKDYTPDGYTAALRQLIEAHKPTFVVFPHTYQVRDYAPKLATALGRVLVSDVVGHRIDSGSLIAV